MTTFRGQKVKARPINAVTEKQPYRRKTALSSKQEGLQTSNLVYEWNTITCITNVTAEAVKTLGGCSSHHLQGAGA